MHDTVLPYRPVVGSVKGQGFALEHRGQALRLWKASANTPLGHTAYQMHALCVV